MRGFARISNKLWRNDKATELEQTDPEAFGVWIMAISYASDNLTDGLISLMALRRLMAKASVADRLVQKGFFVKDGDAYLIHDYLDYQQGKADIEREINGHRDRQKRYTARQNDATSDASDDASSERQPVEGSDASKPVGRTKELKNYRTKELKNERTKELNKTTLVSSREETPTPTTRQKHLYPDEFEEFWQAYPLKQKKLDALRAWKKALKLPGVTNQTLIDGAKRYATTPNVQRGYVRQPATWLNGGSWDDGQQAIPQPELNSAERDELKSRQMYDKFAREEQQQQNQITAKPAEPTSIGNRLSGMLFN